MEFSKDTRLRVGLISTGTYMTPRDRVIAAIKSEQPDDRVPHFERFELTEALFGQSYLTRAELPSLSSSERDRRLSETAELIARVAEYFDYSIVRVWTLEQTSVELEAELIKRVHTLVGKDRLVCFSADATFAIPDGNEMVEFSVKLYEQPEWLHTRYQQALASESNRIKRLIAAGAECVYMNSDYCFNSGPFLSPDKFDEFVTPYLHQQTQLIHQEGAFAIKHTDGNIHSIMDTLIACEIDVLQSLDPMAGVDLKELKRSYHNRICLAGNVDCSLIQNGTPEEIIKDARRSLTTGKPGGGFIFMSSNSIFEGIPLENYMAMWNIWKAEAGYP